MRWLLISLFFAWSGLGAIGKENVPLFDAHAPHVIHYTTTKDLPVGQLKASLLQEVKSFFKIATFVESGTFMGNTTAVAAQIFDEVFSIELLPDFYHNAVKRFKDYRNVTIKLGDSGEIISQLLPSIDRRILFYLDGHYDGGNSGKGKRNTPIFEELAAIRNSGKTDSLILIDDICDFQKSLYPERIIDTCFEGYPDLEELVGEVLKVNSNYQICFLGNALLAFPPTDTVTVSPVTSACALSRLSVVPHVFPAALVHQAEEIIGRAQGKERSELIYYYQAYSDFEYQHGWQSFSSFWYGLTLLQQGHVRQAHAIFYAAALHSLPGWRVASRL